jgi:hypothetical protein
MDGIPLAARFSIATNRLNYCGPSDAEPALYQSILTGRGTPEARRALEGFEALMPYLRAIGAKHDLDPLDARVVEAYWIGNELLDSFGPPEFRSLLEALQRRGLPRSVAERLLRYLPAHPLPHHVFHVAFVGVGAVTGHVPTTLANVESCRPTAATVETVGPGAMRVRSTTLRVDGGRLVPGPELPRELRYDPQVLPTARPGARVVLHWGWPALVLSAAQDDALQRYTERSLAVANEVLPELGVFGSSVTS